MDYTREFFYTAKPKLINVDYDTFLNYIKNYPRKLTRDCWLVSEPPAISYNDFELANRWPHSIVASTYDYDNDPDGYYYTPPEKRNYCIVENYEELFNSKTGNMA